MRPRPSLAAASAATALLLGAVAGAQPPRPVPAGLTPPRATPRATALVGSRPPAQTAAPKLAPDSVARRRPPRRRAPYILGGALVGGATLGGLVLYSAARTDDAFFVGPYAAAAAGAGAVVGGLIGWGIAEARR